MSNDDHIIYCENIVSGRHNNCYGRIHTEKWCTMYIHTYQTKKLPQMASLIPKQTSWLNSHQQTAPGDI